MGTRARLRRAHFRIGQYFRRLPGDTAHARHVPPQAEVSAAMRLTSVRIFVDDLAWAAAFFDDVIGLNRTTTARTAILFADSPCIDFETADDEARWEGLIGRFTG